MLLLVGGLIGQNLVPNPGFENRNQCPVSIGNFVGYVQNWMPSNGSSPDYSGCGFTGNGVINNVPASGTSSAGIWGGAGYGTCTGSGYSEAIRTDLLSPMIMGATYLVQFQVRVDPTGSFTQNPSTCQDFGVYFYNNSTPLANPGYCFNPVTPQFTVSGGSIPRGPYATYSTTIVAGNWNAMVIGPFANANTPNVACNNFNVTRNYYNLDEVVVQPTVVLPGTELHFTGKAHSDFHALNWEVDDPQAFRRFRLERSTNGVDFAAIHESLAVPGQSLYDHLDHAPVDGLNFYRLLGFNANGEVGESSVVTLLRGENGDSRGGLLNYYFDAAAEELHFSLDAGEGGPLRLTLLDVQGREVLSQQIQASSGQQQFRFPVHSVAAGMYILRVRLLNRDASWQAKWVR